jgi:hypothetical protein
VSSSLHVRTETDPVSETWFSSFLEFQTMDKIQNPNNSTKKTLTANFSVISLLLFYDCNDDEISSWKQEDEVGRACSANGRRRATRIGYW